MSAVEVDRDMAVACALAEAWVATGVAKVFDALLSGPSDGYCIEASKIARDVLRHFDVRVRPLPCGIVVFNREGKALADLGVPITEWPATAWSVGVTPDDGHLMVETDDWLADYSLTQFARPGLIDIPRPLVAPKLPVMDGDRGVRYLIKHPTNGVTVIVEPRRERAWYRNGSAWRQRTPTDIFNRLVHGTARVLERITTTRGTPS